MKWFYPYVPHSPSNFLFQEEELAMGRAVHSRTSGDEGGERQQWIPPWMPPSNTVPFTFRPSGKR